MAYLNTSFYKGPDQYSDGDVEEEILNFVEESWEDRDPLEVISFIGDNFAKGYHLSKTRENILNWYPFDINETVIELGAGCGAITGMLCDRLHRVVSVELSHRRSSINYIRNKNKENLEIIVGNFSDIKFEELFDYVILNGVFEYAMSFKKSDSPYIDFLKDVMTVLKPDGKVIIAIENRLGLKYFNGAKEDHTDGYFDGLNNYIGNNSVRTFSKGELKDLLETVGLNYQMFYYPYPDYKFPREIFTKETINSRVPSEAYLNLENDRIKLFDDENIATALRADGVMESFANSFLVVASKKNFESKIQYVKLSGDRKDEYRIATVFEEKTDKKMFSKPVKNIVKKYPLCKSAKSHISKLLELNHVRLAQNIRYLKAKKNVESVEYEFLRDGLINEIVIQMLEADDMDAAKKTINNFFDAYFSSFETIIAEDDIYTDEFSRWFGDKRLESEKECIRNTNIDLILNNIFFKDNSYTLIDGEWIYGGIIPKEFILWRCLNELYYSFLVKRNKYSYRTIMETFGISEENDKTYRMWADHFARKYVGAGVDDGLIKETKNILIRELMSNAYYTNKVEMSLYIDYGDGFSEESKQYTETVLVNGKFSVKFDMPNHEGIKGLRFDPEENRLCRCIITKLSGRSEVIGSNADYQDAGWDVFMTPDPFYFLSNVSGSEIEISGRIEFLNHENK